MDSACVRCVGTLALLVSAVALHPTATARAQCQNCQQGHAGPAGEGTDGDGVYYPGSVYPFGFNYDPNCGACCADMERYCPKKACDKCPWNYGDSYSDLSALTPRFKPTYLGAVEALYLCRQSSRRNNYASLGPKNAQGSNFVLSTDDFDVDLEPGLRATFSRAFTDDLLIEGTFWGLQSYSDTESNRDTTINSLLTAGNLFSPISDFGLPTPISGVDRNTLATIQYDSEISNGELNLRHRVGLNCGPLETSCLIGIRYMQIDEQFSYFTQSNSPGGGATNLVQTSTGNNLIGFQLGVLSAYHVSENWWLEFDVKTCVASNDGEQQTTYTQTISGVTQTFSGTGADHNTAFIGEIGLVSMCQITPNIAVRLGYTGVWVEGIALAEQNAHVNLGYLTLGPTRYNENSHLTYHGPNAGFVITF